MITLTAEIRVRGENPSPFRLGVSRLGEGLLGETIDNTEVINKRNILSLESEIRDRAEIDKPSFGLISSGGQISFRDDNSRFLGYAENGILKGNEPITIFLNNTLSKNREQVGKYFATDWDYDNDNNSVSVSFNDDLEDLQSKTSSKIDISPLAYPQTMLDYIYDRLYNIPNIQFTPNAYSIMQKTKSTTLYKNKSNPWADLKKICEICGFHIYKDFYGNTRMSDEFDMR